MGRRDCKVGAKKACLPSPSLSPLSLSLFPSLSPLCLSLPPLSLSPSLSLPLSLSLPSQYLVSFFACASDPQTEKVPQIARVTADKGGGRPIAQFKS